jgi:hypothetical protein
MGESRNNPRSTQYTGPLPKFIIQPMLGHRFQPKPEWLEANKEAITAGTASPPGPYDVNLEIIISAGMAYPSNLVPQERWPSGVLPLAVIASKSFAEFKAEIDAAIAKAAGPPEC